MRNMAVDLVETRKRHMLMDEDLAESPQSTAKNSTEVLFTRRISTCDIKMHEGDDSDPEELGMPTCVDFSEGLRFQRNESQHEANDDRFLRLSTVTALAEEEDYPDTDSIQDELNEILEAWFEVASDDDIRDYQRHVENVRGDPVGKRALSEDSVAPYFSLVDQEGDTVELRTILRQSGAAVVAFYRGKWCPHGNAALMRYQKELLPMLQEKGIPFVAISPMLPDGTVFLASKKHLQFSVCSDPESRVAKQFGITFQVQPHARPFFEKWGHDVPFSKKIPSWEMTVPALFVIGANRRIRRSFVDTDRAAKVDFKNILTAFSDFASDKEVCTNDATNFPCPEQNREEAEEVSAKKRKLFCRKSGRLSLRRSARDLIPAFLRKKKDPSKLSSKLVEQKDDKSELGSLEMIPRKFRASHASVRTSRTFRASQASSEFLVKYVLPEGI